MGGGSPLEGGKAFGPLRFPVGRTSNKLRGIRRVGQILAAARACLPGPGAFPTLGGRRYGGIALIGVWSDHVFRPDPTAALLTRLWSELGGRVRQKAVVPVARHGVPLPARTDVAALSWACVAAASLAAADLAGAAAVALDPDRIADRLLQRTPLPPGRRADAGMGTALRVLPLLGRVGAHARQLPASCRSPAARPRTRARRRHGCGRHRLAGNAGRRGDAGRDRGRRPVRRRLARERRRRRRPSRHSPGARHAHRGIRTAKPRLGSAARRPCAASASST